MPQYWDIGRHQETVCPACGMDLAQSTKYWQMIDLESLLASREEKL